MYAGALVTYFIPPPEERIPISWNNLAAPFVLPLVHYFFISYLTRRHGTYLLRLAYLPIGLGVVLRATFAYTFTDPNLFSYNCGRGLIGIALFARTIEFTLARDGRKKIGETTVGVTPGVQKFAHDTKAPWSLESVSRSLWRGLSDSFELLCNLRGIGWDFGTGAGIHIPKTSRDISSRPRFLAQTVISLALNFLAADLLDSALKLVPGLGTPEGTTIFFPSLPPVQRYAFSLTISLGTALYILTNFTWIYDLLTLVGVGLVGQSPTLWPPLFDSPLTSTSLHYFWSKGWHQLLRQTFFVCGGFPFQSVMGTPGLIFGTFLGSAILHEFGIWVGGHGTDMRAAAFFMLQPVGIGCERLWRRYTGRRTGGWLGMIWAYLWVLGIGQFCADAWISKGLGSGTTIPPALSLTQKYILPSVLPIVKDWTQ
ncbi:hypothetical protein BOTBODRAFT_190046 [Botryobasidium botryosum FD-172 SS1]|uniref:Wax synthase domain-containing protein n=1 Tax=Botryobasidium botryosum (strain FD-172 SS1) TaxID=930990 RepID=A0A067M6A0_BOTB1|nr:hypothetical protein BOTBODRAFT_190046 [Botryobasidium botryosum FD-172 SS1]